MPVSQYAGQNRMKAVTIRTAPGAAIQRQSPRAKNAPPNKPKPKINLAVRSVAPTLLGMAFLRCDAPLWQCRKTVSVT